MAKLIDDQVKKTEILITGLRKNKYVLKNLDLDEAVINELEVENQALDVANQELERSKAEAKAKSKDANLKLNALREQFLNIKNKVKRNTTAENWKDYGVLDKR
jgi:hypothetical protein